MFFRQFFKHPGQAGAQGVDGADVQILVCDLVEIDVEVRFKVLFRRPVADHDRNFWQYIKDPGDIGIQVLDGPSVENVQQIDEKIIVVVGDLFERFFTALPEQSAPLPDIGFDFFFRRARFFSALIRFVIPAILFENGRIQLRTVAELLFPLKQLGCKCQAGLLVALAAVGLIQQSQNIHRGAGLRPNGSSLV